MATLTTTGNANLTSSTNWSPAQTPVAGDDLVINGAHTLTLDADLVFNSVTFQNAGARLAIGGTTRVVGSTTGWNVLNVNLSAVLITTAIPSGTSLTLRGTWRSSGTNGGIASGIANSTGGNLTLATIGDDPAGVLFEMPNTVNAGRVITASWTGGTLTTIGRFDLPNWTAASFIVSMTGGTWSHTNTGTSTLGAGGHIVFVGSGSSSISWSGELITSANGNSDIFRTGGSNNSSISGIVQRISSNSASHAFASQISPVITHNGNAILTITGKINNRSDSRGVSIVTSGSTSTCRINWRNQSLSIASDEAIVIMNGNSCVIDMTDLQITNTGRFVYVETGSAQAVVDANTLITNTTPSAQAAVVSASGALDGKVINLASDAPTLPSVEDVAAGVSYGYTVSPLTGTGLIIDPAVLASSVGAALDNISATALARFVTVDTGETSAAIGSVASFGGGGGGPTAIEIADEVQTRTIARVTLVDTCTANTDMRGTDNALLASSYTTPPTPNQIMGGLVTGTQPAGSLARFVRDIKQADVLFEGQIVTAGAQSATLDAGATTVCVGQAITIGEEGDADRQTRWVVAFDPATKVVTLDKPWCVIPNDGSDYQIKTQRRALDQADKETIGKLDDLIELDGSDWRFTAKALEEGPGGGGSGSTIVNVLPAVGISADRSPGVTLKAFVGETITQSITLYETNGTTPIVLTGKTLVIVFETRQGLDVATVPNSGISVSGDDDNVVTFNYPSAATSQERVLKFALRDAAAPNTVYLQGLLSVQRAPKVDV